MVIKRASRLVAKEKAVELLSQGMKERSVMTELMGEFGYPYSTAYSIVQEAKAWVEKKGKAPEGRTIQADMKERIEREEAEMRAGWGDVKEVDETK